MPTLKITEGDYRTLLQYESTLKQLQPSAELDDLNAYLVYSNEEPNGVTFIFRDPVVHAQIQLPCKMEFISPTSEETTFAVTFNYQKFLFILHAYSVDDLTKMVITLNFSEQSSFKIETLGDKIDLAHTLTSAVKIKEVTSFVSANYPSEDISFQLSLFNDDKVDFVRGLEECLDFVSPDEKKNNAFALYNDRIIVNDVRHMFVYRLNHAVPFLSNDVAVSLHKKPAKIFTLLSKKGISFDASITKDTSKIYISAPNFQAIVNNSIANVVPPDPEQLEAIEPLVPVARIEQASTLMEASNFFSGFYSASADFNSITVDIEKEGILLRQWGDNGTPGFNVCNVQRRIACSTEEKALQSVDIIYDSFRAFLQLVSPDEDVTFLLDKHLAFLMTTRKKQIYISKLNEEEDE